MAGASRDNIRWAKDVSSAADRAEEPAAWLLSSAAGYQSRLDLRLRRSLFLFCFFSLILVGGMAAPSRTCAAVPDPGLSRHGSIAMISLVLLAYG